MLGGATLVINVRHWMSAGWPEMLTDRLHADCQHMHTLCSSDTVVYDHAIMGGFSLHSCRLHKILLISQVCFARF